MQGAWLTYDTFIKVVLLLDDCQICALWTTGRELHSQTWIWNKRVLPYLCRLQKIQLDEWTKEHYGKQFRLCLNGCSTFLNTQGPFLGILYPKAKIMEDGVLYKYNWLFYTSKFAKYWFDFMPCSFYSKNQKKNYCVLFLHIEYSNDSTYREDIIRVKRFELTTYYMLLSLIKVHGSVVSVRYFDRRNELHVDYY